MKLTLPYPPSANRYWRNYRGMTVTSGEAIAYKREVAYLARKAGVVPCVGDVVVTLDNRRQGTVTVAWNRRDASRQVVLVVNTYPLSPELEAAVRELETAAFCEGA